MNYRFTNESRNFHVVVWRCVALKKGDLNECMNNYPPPSLSALDHLYLNSPAPFSGNTADMRTLRSCVLKNTAGYSFPRTLSKVASAFASA